MKRTTLLRNFSIFPLVVLFLLLLFSCRTKQPMMTESLYMQYKRVNIDYPYGDGEGENNVLSEIVSYTTPSDSNDLGEYALDDSVQLDTNRVYRLDEVKVEVRSTFAPERNGRVAVDFLIRVPKELISDNWRMTLSPELLVSDSVISLKDVILYGKEFRAFQDSSYAAYAAYERSIIPKDSYDDFFLDQKGIHKDLRRRQELFYGLYKTEWKRRMNYSKWIAKTNSRHYHFNLRKDANRLDLFHKYSRKAEYEKVRFAIIGRDTTGVSSHYMHKFEKKADFYPQYYLHRELSARSMPGKYRDIYRAGDTITPLRSNSLTEEDSVAIARDRYFFDAIAENETKDKLRDHTFRKLVPFPYLDGERIKLDTLFNEKYNFFYLYRHEYPITTGLDKLKVTLKGHVDAIDLSGYTLPNSDTLTYIVSSMDQLVDTNLIVKETKIYRDLKHNMTVYFKFPANRWEFDASYEDNQAQLDTLMNTYRRFAQDEGLIIDAVNLTAAASLDGNYHSNTKLSQRRAESLREYLASRSGKMMGGKSNFTANSIGEDWVLARQLIRQHPDIANKEAILTKMARVTDPDKVEADIRWGFKKDYQIIRNEIYPKLRRVDISFSMRRPGMLVTDSVHSEYRQDYAEALRLIENKDYINALEILRNYSDYNTALCLLSMGYKENAYQLLTQLEPNANVHYLTALVLCQLGHKSEAATHLIEACTLDPDKVFRISKDMELKMLVRDFNLQPHLDALGG